MPTELYITLNQGALWMPFIFSNTAYQLMVQKQLSLAVAVQNYQVHSLTNGPQQPEMNSDDYITRCMESYGIRNMS